MQLKTTTLLAIASIFCSVAYAQNETLKLIIEYTHTIDTRDGKKSDTVGSHVITITPQKDGTIEIKKEGLGAIFKGEMTADEIYGHTRYKLENLHVTQEIRINRYTGIATVTWETDRGGLIHHGKCRVAEKKLF